MTPLGAIVTAIGAAIVVASTAIAGLRFHKAVERHAPGLASLIPRDGPVLLGISIGVFCVWSWI